MHVLLQLGPVLVLGVASLSDLVGKLPLLPACRHPKHYLLDISEAIVSVYNRSSLRLLVTPWGQMVSVFVFFLLGGRGLSLMHLFDRFQRNFRF